jgi:hypothetical protein
MLRLAVISGLFYRCRSHAFCCSRCVRSHCSSAVASAPSVGISERDCGGLWRLWPPSSIHATSGCLGPGLAASGRFSSQYLHRCLPRAVSRNLWPKLGAMASFAASNSLDSLDSPLHQTIDSGTPFRLGPFQASSVGINEKRLAPLPSRFC